jgi:hypothetical protein
MPEQRSRAEPKAAFMCECGAGLCEARVQFSGEEYDAHVEPVLAEGHGPVGGALGKYALCGRPHGGDGRNGR